MRERMSTPSRHHAARGDRLAADRDGIAREWATSYVTTFERGVPTLLNARADGLAMSDAIVETYLTLLAGTPDTHIVRRGGDALAQRVSRLAADALAAGGVRSEGGRRVINAMDRVARSSEPCNPATSRPDCGDAVCRAAVGGWTTVRLNRTPREGSRSHDAARGYRVSAQGTLCSRPRTPYFCRTSLRRAARPHYRLLVTVDGA